MRTKWKATQLFLLNSLEMGGSEKKIVAVANALHRRGWPVHLAYLNPPETLLGQLLPDLPRICLGRSSRFDLGVVRRLAAYVQAEGVENIHCVNRYPLIYGRLVAPRRADGTLGLTAFLNSTDLPSQIEQAKMILYAPLLRACRGVIFGCRYQREMWVRRYGLAPDRCSYIYNGVRADHFDPDRLPAQLRLLRSQLGWKQSDIVVGMVGQLRAKKGYPDFISACAALRRDGFAVKALIVGGGPERAALERLARTTGLAEHIRFVGEMSDVRQALYAMDVFALTSVKSETFSNAALEAMAMARPVVLSQLGGAAEMVDAGRSGYLYQVGDVDGLIAHLRRLAEDAEHRRELGREARQRVLARFTFERMIDGYEAVLRSVGTGLQPVTESPTVNG
ncbi:MAG TPA: glycosyltransferase family 4 protein [Gammaproteobacteria bacterium]|nr:glycosyltransferase family 4 protein [Gammaproteobacteria bacterium]